MSALGDLLTGHPIRFIQDIPGEKYVQGMVGKGIGNIVQDIEEAPGGLYALAKQAVTDPGALPGTFEQMGKGFLTSIEHPGRRPGDTLMNLLMLTGGVGAVAGRLGEAAAISSRAGALPEDLSAAIKAGQGVKAGSRYAPGVTAESIARQMGRAQEYNRIVNPTTGAVNPVSSQIKEAFIRGPAQQERLIRVKGAIDPNEGLTLENTKQFTTPDGVVTHGWYYSKDPLIRSAQKLIDHMYDTHADNPNSPIWNIARKATPFYRTQSGRFQMAAKAYNLTVQKENTAEAAQFARKYGESGDAQHLALRMVAEGVTPEALTAAHNRWLATGKLGPKLTAETRARLNMIPEAAKYLDKKVVKDDVTGTERTIPVPSANHPEFAQYVNDARNLANRRSVASQLAGVLSDSSKFGRLVSPFSVVHTDTVPTTLETLKRELGQRTKGGEATTGNESRVAELRKQIADQEHGPQLSFDVEGFHDPIASGAFKDDAEMQRFANEANLFRVPYAFDRQGIRSRLAPGSYYRRAYGGRKPRVPSTYTHPFKGAILRGGGGDTNVARLLAESYTEAHRFVGLRAVRNRLLQSAQLTPERIPEEYRQLIRTDERPQEGHAFATQQQAERLVQQTRRENDNLMDKESLSPEEMMAGGKLYDGIRQHIFPEKGHVANMLENVGGFTKGQISKMLGEGDSTEFQPIPGYKWIDKRLLGGLEKKNPLTFAYDNAIVAKAIRGADAINTALRGIMLYLRPAYAAPNMLGNIGLNLIHQGMLAPFHMARNFAVWRGLSKADRDIMRVQMGEGLGESGFKQMTGLGQKIQAGSAYLGKKYGKVVDEPFRLNSFLHEAANQGYTTAEQVKALLRDPAHSEDLRSVTNRANEAMINYERMGPGEESVARRLVLFYPFIKGATRYANYFYKEHPVAAGLQSNLGELGRQRSEEAFGPLGLPPWAEGLIPYGGSKQFPITGNPASAGILNTPADLTKTLMNIVAAHPLQGLEAAGNMAPVESALLTLLTGGQYQNVKSKPGTPLLREAWSALAGGLPPTTLIHRVLGKAGSGAPLAMSSYPDPSLLNAILSFGVGGGLAPRRTSVGRMNAAAWKAAHPR